jgi:hypothetical protein
MNDVVVRNPPKLYRPQGGYVPYPLVTMDVTRQQPLRSGPYADHATVQVVGLKTSSVEAGDGAGARRR